MSSQHPFNTMLPPQIPALRGRAMNLSRNTDAADDLVQATLLKAWASRDSYRPDTNLRAWLFTILRNTFFSDLRKLRREVEDVDGAHAQALFDEAPQDHAVALSELMSVIALMPEFQRKPLILMGAYGYSLLETADACGCAAGTVKSRVSRSRATLQQVFSQDTVTRSDQMSSAAGKRRTARFPRTDAIEARMTSGVGQ